MPGAETERPKQGVFKDELNPEVVAALAGRLGTRVPGSDPRSFQAQALEGLEDLELKARVAQVADALRAHLPADGPTMLGLLPRLALDDTGSPVITSFGAWPIVTVVERHGLPWPAEALVAMRLLTPCFSSELAIRPFLATDPVGVLAEVVRWTDDPDPHVRRLVSEGTRPKLPWGGHLRAFIEEPQLTLALLERLRNDPAEYVQRSVANHLGDIAKDHPDLAVEVLGRWQADPGPGTDFMVRHGLRNLVKKGHAGALALQGYRPVAFERAELEVAPGTLVFGERLHLSLRLEAQEAAPLHIELGLHLRKANGELRPTVLYWTRRELKAGKVLRLDKRLAIKPISTRRYYPGAQAVDVRVNGAVVAGPVPFELVMPD